MKCISCGHGIGLMEYVTGTCLKSLDTLHHIEGEKKADKKPAIILAFSVKDKPMDEAR